MRTHQEIDSRSLAMHQLVAIDPGVGCVPRLSEWATAMRQSSPQEIMRRKTWSTRIRAAATITDQYKIRDASPTHPMHAHD